MRAADAAEKVSSQNPELLRPFKAQLLRLLEEVTQQELRWHLAQMVPRLPLNRQKRVRATAALQSYLSDRSSIVKTCALQALVELAVKDDLLLPAIKRLLQDFLKTGTAAMKARSRKLLVQLDRHSPTSRD